MTSVFLETFLFHCFVTSFHMFEPKTNYDMPGLATYKSQSEYVVEQPLE